MSCVTLVCSYLTLAEHLFHSAHKTVMSLYFQPFEGTVIVFHLTA